MGARGPVPMPDNVRKLRGTKVLRTTTPDGSTRPAKRLVLPPKLPAPPAGLSAMARAEWRRVGKELERAGVISEIDRGALTAYCTAWDHMMKANATLTKEGVTRVRDGEVVKHPAWQIYREANRTMLAVATQLYLTPTSRLRIPVPQGATVGDPDADDLFD